MTMDTLSRLRGGIYGVAAGDALGATVEFMSRKDIRATYGAHKEITGGGWLGLRPGEHTDDTEMTLAVADGLSANPVDPVPEVGRNFLRWYETRPRDIGNIIRSSIRNFKLLGSWEAAARSTHDEMGGKSAGNGSLMRTLPISFAYQNDRGKMIEMAMKISGMTHHDPQAGICCVLYNELLRLITTNFPAISKHGLVDEAVRCIQNHFAKQTESLPGGFWNKIKNAGSLQERQVVASGYVLDSLIASLWSFLHSDSFVEAVTLAVNLGDDADTVGAICGGLAGTFYSFESIPERWIETLREKNRLESAVKGLL